MSGAVLITGAGTRVGRILADGLAADGWAVAIHYNRSADSAESAARNINAAGGTAATIQANLFIPDDVNQLIDRAGQALGQPLTALVNNASTFEPDSAQTYTDAMMQYHMQVNLRAPLNLSRDLAAQIPSDAQGCVINMIDNRVLKPNPLYFTYSLSKASLYWATKTLAQSLAPHVRVNGIGPGPTLRNTAQKDGEFEAEAAATLLGHGSPPDTLLQAARYLLNASSVTGQMIAVDGGQHLNWRTPDLTEP